MSQKITNYQMIIDGKYTNSITEKTIEVECPANRRIFATVPRGNEADVDIAVKSSLKAFRSWSKVMPKERGKILLQIADAIKNNGALTSLYISDNGIPDKATSQIKNICKSKKIVLSM